MRRLALVMAVVVTSGCATPAKRSGAGAAGVDTMPSVATALAPATTTAGAATLDTRAIEEAIGLTGATLPDGAFRISRPRGDLAVSLDGFAITPRMGLAGWIGFRAHASGALLLGVMPVAIDELQAVVSALMNAGLEATALHAHFVGEEPGIVFVHFGGLGSPVALARGVRDLLDAIVRVRTAHPLKPQAAQGPSDLDPARLDAVLGLSGEHDGQVYRVTAPRTDLRISELGIELGATLSPTSWAAFRGTAERAAVAGELVVLPAEVQAVVHALRERRIGVVGIHDDSTRAEPRVVLVSFWGVGQPGALAAGVRKALDKLPRGE